ncbi:MAG: response regulator [Flavobacteriales bacterium]
MNNPSILIVEDEPKVASFIKKGLEENSFDVEIAYDGFIGKKMALSNDYDVVILDVNIPLFNGFEVCKEIRAVKSNLPILMLTALSSTEDKLLGFDLGVDDYLVKPFEFRELLARIRVLLKHKKHGNISDNTIKIADLTMNLDSRIVTRGEQKIVLTSKEYSLLEYLLKHKGRVVKRSEIAERIWDITFDTGTNVIDVYINFLRKKIDKDFSPKLIHTHFGVGYVLKEE